MPFKLIRFHYLFLLAEEWSSISAPACVFNVYWSGHAKVQLLLLIWTPLEKGFRKQVQSEGGKYIFESVFAFLLKLKHGEDGCLGNVALQGSAGNYPAEIGSVQTVAASCCYSYYLLKGKASGDKQLTPTGRSGENHPTFRYTTLIGDILKHVSGRPK